MTHKRLSVAQTSSSFKQLNMHTMPMYATPTYTVVLNDC